MKPANIFLSIPDHSGVKAEKIHKGRIWEDLTDMWRVFGGTPSLVQSQGKPRQIDENLYFDICFYMVCSCVIPDFNPCFFDR